MFILYLCINKLIKILCVHNKLLRLILFFFSNKSIIFIIFFFDYFFFIDNIFFIVGEKSIGNAFLMLQINWR